MYTPYINAHIHNLYIWNIIIIYIISILKYTMEYYSAIKKKEILPFAATCMKLEGIMLSEISEIEKDYCIISLVCGI